MVGPRIRPRFELAVELPPDEVLARVWRGLDESGDTVEGIVFPETAELTIPERERHFWSPQLMLSVTPRDEVTLVRGRYGPHHHVWAMFVAIYSLLAFVGACGLILGFSQWTLGTTPWALWGVPASAGLAVVTYVGALSGQALGSDQMDQLREFLDNCLADDGADRVTKSAPAG